MIADRYNLPMTSGLMLIRFCSAWWVRRWGLIRELERLRDFLNKESLHIQREIEDYGRLTDEVKTSTKIIAESVAHLKNEGERIAGRAAEDSSLRSFVSSTAE
jgi:hypothetical protein